MPVSSWNLVPANNNVAIPNGWPEGMAPSNVNDVGRQMMADIRAFYDSFIAAGGVAFCAQRVTSLQSMPASTVTTAIFNQASTNDGSAYDASTGIFTAPSAGVYHFDAMAFLVPGGTNCTLNAIYFSINNFTGGVGTRFDIGIGTTGQLYSNTGNALAFAGSITLRLAVTDTVRVKWDAGTSGASTNNLGLTSHFSGARVA